MEQTVKSESGDSVIYQVEARVAAVTLNIPQRGNALSIPMMEGLRAALQNALLNPDVAMIALHARGKHFCTGADLSWAGARADGNEALWNQGNAALQALLDTLFALSKPVVARVHGTVLGGGVAMLCLCDDVVALDQANWRLPELPLGMVPSAIVPSLRQVAPAHAIRRMLYDQTPWNSVDAHGFGIVTHVASEETLDALVRSRIEAWLALSPSAVAATKRWMREMGADDYRKSIERGLAHAAPLKKFEGKKINMQQHSAVKKINAVAARRMQRGHEILTQLKAAASHTYTSWLRARAQEHLARPALVHHGRTLTYEQLFDAVDGARQALHERGVREQQTVALLMNNNDHYLIWFLAVLGLGAVAVPLNNRLVAPELAFILEHSQSALVITEPAFVPVLGQVRQAHGLNLGEVVADVDAPITLGQSQRYQQEPEGGAAAPAAVYYTSGTTGKPKGVVHTHVTLIADAMQSPDAWEYNHDMARLLAITPLFHIAAHTCFFPVLSIGGTLYIETYHTEQAIELVRREGITTFFAVPSILLLMVDKARTLGVTLDKVKTVLFGAAPMTIARLGDVQALFPNASLVHGMGQTESGGTLVTLPGVVAMERAGSVGIPMAAVEVAIFDMDDQEMPRGQIGELVARGPNVMKGYLRDEKATAETLRNGWLHTGDLGYQSDEGLITLADRKKDMIIRGGENIYSSEVEQALLRHPLIKTAAVVGQPHPLFGEQVCAFVTTDRQAPEPTADELLSYCRSQLADYKVPAAFHFVEELPMNSTGKILKAQLRAMLVTTKE